MKQHITPKQASEITEEQFYSLFNNQHWGSFRRKDYANFHHKKVTIGKCIEVLGRSLDEITNYHNEYGVNFRKYQYDKEGAIIHTEYYFETSIELMDALWEAVKSICAVFAIEKEV